MIKRSAHSTQARIAQAPVEGPHKRGKSTSLDNRGKSSSYRGKSTPDRRKSSSYRGKSSSYGGKSSSYRGKSSDSFFYFFDGSPHHTWRPCAWRAHPTDKLVRARSPRKALLRLYAPTPWGRCTFTAFTVSCSRAPAPTCNERHHTTPHHTIQMTARAGTRLDPYYCVLSCEQSPSAHHLTPAA